MENLERALLQELTSSHLARPEY